MPYIFTDDELRRVFAESDKELKRSDFCYEDKTLYIRKNKSHRERLIPVSAGVADMCQQYLGKAGRPDTGGGR